jgi:diaminopimelate decarboxylase
VSLAAASGRVLEAFDIGGGWTPGEYDARFAADARWRVGALRSLAPGCPQVFFEPGQAIATPCEALLATVVEVRKVGSRREAIINAGYPDWLAADAYLRPPRVHAK